MPSNQELSCIYAALILHDNDVPITGDKITTILKAANVEFEPFWPGLYAKALEGVNVTDLITSSVCSGFESAGAAPAAAAPVSAVAATAEEKGVKRKEEANEESDDDMGFGLFD